MGRISSVALTPIGVIRTEHVDGKDTPRQPSFAKGCPGQVEVHPEYEDGLDGIENYSHIFLIFLFDRSDSFRMKVVPPHETRERGVFASRAPRRPNQIGLSLVRLVRRDGRVLHVEDVDMLDGTPILDIKPFSPAVDLREDATANWPDEAEPETT